MDGAVDDGLLGLAKRAVGNEYGLSPQEAARLHGTSASELRADAKTMRTELGLPPLDERERDEHGRFHRAKLDVNTVIRAARR
jgi:hypothetical protein